METQFAAMKPKIYLRKCIFLNIFSHSNAHFIFLYFEVYYFVVERGVVVGWLDRLDYGAENRRKVVSSSLGFAMRRLEHSLCQPSSKRVPFMN